MNDKFSDEMLDVGKILILSPGHGLTVKKLKSQLLATSVKCIKWGKGNDVEDLIFQTILNALEASDEEDCYDFSFYYVKGMNATTSFLRLKSEHVFASVEWQSKNVKELHNACMTNRALRRAIYSVNSAKNSYDDLNEMLDKQKLNNTIKNFKSMFSLISTNFAETEKLENQEKIERNLESTW